MNKLKKILFAIIVIIIIFSVGMTFNYINEKNSENKLLNQESEVYSIKDKNFYLYEEADGREEDFRGMKLLEYDNSCSKEYAEIYYVFYDYTTDPSYYYSLEITDETNENLLIEGKKYEQIVGGVISNAKIKNIDLDKKLMFLYLKNMHKQMKLLKVLQWKLI